VRLFAFDFTANLDWRKCDVLREASGMTIDLRPRPGQSPGRGWIGKGVMLHMEEGKAPDRWVIEAWVAPNEPHDAPAVEQRRARIREAIRKVSTEWSEDGPEALLPPTTANERGDVRNIDPL
jgi:hypothetical protein